MRFDARPSPLEQGSAAAELAIYHGGLERDDSTVHQDFEENVGVAIETELRRRTFPDFESVDRSGRIATYTFDAAPIPTRSKSIVQAAGRIAPSGEGT